MEPSFYDHEYLIIDEISYRFREPERGEIIVFKYPKDPSQYFIKRVIGLPGDQIQIKDGKIFIYDETHGRMTELEENYLGSEVETFSNTQDTIQLSNDEYFVLGDNRNHSKDSRSFGPVKGSFIVGRVLFRGWPLNRVTIFHAPVYQFL